MSGSNVFLKVCAPTLDAILDIRLRDMMVGDYSRLNGNIFG